MTVVLSERMSTLEFETAAMSASELEELVLRQRARLWSLERASNLAIRALAEGRHGDAAGLLTTALTEGPTCDAP